MTRDEQIGAAVRHYLAEGFKWSQSTQWAVEAGRRPLRLREAAALAELFGLEHVSDLDPASQETA